MNEILLLRSARHLQVGIRALEAAFPGSTVSVVGQRGSEALLEQAGVAPANRFIYEDRPFFTPVAFLRSAAGRAVRKRRFIHVAVLWPDPAGTGYGNVGRTALALSPRRFLAITPDGSVIAQHSTRLLLREVRTAMTSAATLLILGVLLYAPAAVLRLLTTARLKPGTTSR